MYARLMRGLSRHAGLRVFKLFSRTLEAGAAVAAGTLELRYLAERETLALCADPELGLSAPKAGAAFARGDLCAGAFDGNRLAGYCWLAFAPLPHLDDVWVDFPPEAVWTYKSFVRPADRGRRIAPALYRFGDDLCQNRGRRLSIICVESHNGPSVAAARRAGYASAGYAAYLHAAGRLLAGYSPAAKQRGVAFYRSETGAASRVPSA